MHYSSTFLFYYFRELKKVNQALQKEKNPPFPKRIVISILNRCNLSCKYCCVNFSKKGCFIDFEMFSKIVQEAVNLGVIKISLSGHGEPTLHPQILKMVEKIVGYGKKVNLDTNGLVLNNLLKKIISKIDGLNLHIPFYTLKGANKVLANSKVAKKYLTNLEKNLTMISNHNLKIKLIFVLSRYNYKDLFPIVMNLGKNKKFFWDIRLPMYSSLKYRWFYEEQIHDLKIDLLKLINLPYVKNNSSLFNALQSIIAMKERECGKNKLVLELAEPRKRCYVPWIINYIDYQGKVYALPKHMFARRNSVGQLNQKSLKDIWNSKNMFQWQLKAIKRYPLFVSKYSNCNSCKWDYNNVTREIRDYLDSFLE